MRRAGVSVPANIVEGSSRQHTKEYLHFLYTAISSLYEVGYYIDFSHRVGYLQDVAFGKLVPLHEHTTKTLRALINYIEKSQVQSKGTKSKVYGLGSKV
jgi:four helix bundle protein